MKRFLPLVLAICALAPTPGLAGEPARAAIARTGDAWADAVLDDVSVYGATYRDAFVDELVRYHRAPRELVLELLARPGWSPGDVYLACSLASQAARPCRSVVHARSGDPARGWGAVADEFGIAPGTPGFQALKRGLAASYGRWARPLPLDAKPPRDSSGSGGTVRRPASARAAEPRTDSRPPAGE